jgi:hypothetical protein
MNTRTLISLPLLPFLLFSCKETKLKQEYRVKDSFEVVAGEYTGTKGETEYTIRISDIDAEARSFAMENFAGEYKVKATIRGDSISIPSQEFPYYESHVTILGRGKVAGDSLYLEYFSGGPQGQIEGICIGVAEQ